MIKNLVFLGLLAFCTISCTNTSYKDGLTISKMNETTIFTTDGSEIPLRPQGFEEASTVILVRHAETDPSDNSDNPTLSTAGFDRAQRLAELLSSAGIDTYAMSSTKRTIFTARPFADITDNYSPKTYDIDQIDRLTKWAHETHKGETLLIYGHTNTTPMVINNLTGKSSASDIPHDQYDNLYIVNTLGPGAESVVYQFKY